MHFPFYEEHKTKRVNKIINLFGKPWFKDKNILELGACHGDIGIEFLKLGANVLFTDARQENLDEIKSKIDNPNLQVLNQNKFYSLKTQFDLVLHLGTLWHLENWYEDLKCATTHGKFVILETKVLPIPGNLVFYTNVVNEKYNAYNSKEALFTQDAIEQRLIDLGCTFIRLDDPCLNTDFSLMTDDVYVRHVYDWTSEIFTYDIKKIIHHRRMWLIGDHSSVGRANA